MQAEDKKYLGIKFVHLLLLPRPEISERALFSGSWIMFFTILFNLVLQTTKYFILFQGFRLWYWWNVQVCRCGLWRSYQVSVGIMRCFPVSHPIFQLVRVPDDDHPPACGWCGRVRGRRLGPDCGPPTSRPRPLHPLSVGASQGGALR